MLHNRGRVHPDTEARVRRIIKELNYRANIFAKHLKMGRVFTFGVLMPRPQQDSYYWLLPYRGIEKAQQELASHRVRASFFFFDRFNDKSVLTTGQKLLKVRLDGLLAAPVLPGSFLQFCPSLPPGLPLVWSETQNIKWKTALQMVALGALVLGESTARWWPGLPAHEVGVVCLFLAAGLSPNAITIVASLIGFTAAAGFSMGTYGAGVAAALVFQLAAVIDCCDGEVARLTFAESPFGAAGGWPRPGGAGAVTSVVRGCPRGCGSSRRPAGCGCSPASRAGAGIRLARPSTGPCLA